MDYQTLEIVRDGPVATVWLNRPEVRNAFNEITIAELTAVFTALDRDEQVRAGRARPGLLRRRRPELDEEDGRL
jgi:enoyl-CoA hydratase/carnithine racemase